MTEPTQLRVFVNGKALFVPHGATALDAVRQLDPALADAIAAGERAVTDSRGLPVPPSSAATGGAVYRVVSARALRDQDPS
ncbi:MAG: hypothetical protein HYR75_07570 [Gemmatimonadetes bacterium]|nr:hypothetical protein [Gemmatimonadota bacterium]MBI3568075.1 hypothetical protein [Gemmatimonadota bacterium]